MTPMAPPKPGTLEGALYAVAEDRCIFNSRRLDEALRDRATELTPRTDASTNHGYSALGSDRFDGSDGVVFIRDVVGREEQERADA